MEGGPAPQQKKKYYHKNHQNRSSDQSQKVHKPGCRFYQRAKTQERIQVAKPQVQNVQPKHKSPEKARPQALVNQVQVPSLNFQPVKYIDQKRYLCSSRPQYIRSCGMSSLVSCWNFIFSKIGHGTYEVLTQEKALLWVGLLPPFEDIMFGPFTGNDTLIKWWGILAKKALSNGKARVAFRMGKPHATHNWENCLLFQRELFQGLQNKRRAYIYHCSNHYMVIAGFIRGPTPETTWLIISEISPSYPPFHMIRWSDVIKDMSSQLPEYLNVRKTSASGHPEMQVNQNFDGSKSINVHCIMEFSAI